MNYTLEILKDGNWITVKQDDDPEALHKLVPIWRAGGSTGHRIFKTDRKRRKDGSLAGPTFQTPKRPASGPTDARRQAEGLVEWIEKTGTKTIRVFPLGKTGMHTSNKFRLYLFSTLMGASKTYPDDRDRMKAEAAAVEAGYKIVEVSPEEWGFST